MDTSSDTKIPFKLYDLNDVRHINAEHFPLDDDDYCWTVEMTPHLLYGLADRAQAHPMGFVGTEDESEWIWEVSGRRAVLPVGGLHVSKTTEQFIRKQGWNYQLNVGFDKVIHHCATVERPEDKEEDADEYTQWLDTPTQRAYKALHYGKERKAYSVTVLNAEGEIVGGLFGLNFPTYISVDSMFSLTPNASKAAMVALDLWAGQAGKRLVDMETFAPHLGALGAMDMDGLDFRDWVERIKKDAATNALGSNLPLFDGIQALDATQVFNHARYLRTKK